MTSSPENLPARKERTMTPNEVCREVAELARASANSIWEGADWSNFSRVLGDVQIWSLVTAVSEAADGHELFDPGGGDFDHPDLQDFMRAATLQG